MSDIFNSQPGMVTHIDLQNAVPAVIAISTPDTFTYEGAIIESINYEQATNQQFMSTLDNTVYVYIFGDRMGTVQIKGKVFHRVCPQHAVGEVESGVEFLMKWYGDNRASKNTTLIEITIGKETIKGFLTAVGLGGGDPKFLMHNFVLNINTLPTTAGVGQNVGRVGADKQRVENDNDQGNAANAGRLDDPTDDGVFDNVSGTGEGGGPVTPEEGMGDPNPQNPADYMPEIGIFNPGTGEYVETDPDTETYYREQFGSNWIQPYQEGQLLPPDGDWNNYTPESKGWQDRRRQAFENYVGDLNKMPEPTSNSVGDIHGRGDLFFDDVNGVPLYPRDSVEF